MRLKEFLNKFNIDIVKSDIRWREMFAWGWNTQDEKLRMLFVW